MGNYVYSSFTFKICDGVHLTGRAIRVKIHNRELTWRRNVLTFFVRGKWLAANIQVSLSKFITGLIGNLVSDSSCAISILNGEGTNIFTSICITTSCTSINVESAGEF